MRAAIYFARRSWDWGLIPVYTERYYPIRPGDIMLSIMSFAVAIYIDIVLCFIAFFFVSFMTFILIVFLAPIVLFLLTSFCCRWYLEVELREALEHINMNELLDHKKEKKK